jgi:cell division initiation protein
MRISPLDIRKQSFKKSMRGVDTEEVRIFLELVASEYEKVLQENAMMAEKLRYQEDRLGEYRELEKSMRNSLVTADRIASESRDASEREANRVVQDAHLRAERILEDARERLQGLIQEIEALKGKKEVYARRFWALVESQLSVLQEYMQDEGEVESLRRRVEHLVAETSQPPFPEPPAFSDEQVPVPSSTQEPMVGSRYAPDPAASSRYAPEPPPQQRYEPTPVSRYAPDYSAEPAAPSRHAPERDDRREPEPEETRTKRSLPRGLGRLLRGRQANLPLEEPASRAASDDHEDPPPDDRGGLFPIRERREGYVEIRAGEGRNGDGRDGDGRDQPAPPRGPFPRDRS